MKRLSCETALDVHHGEGGENLGQRYDVLKERLLKIEYTQTSAGFAGGNDHGPAHIERVLENLDKILGPTPLQHLSIYELWLTMMAVVYHDVGLLQQRDGHPEIGAELLLSEDQHYIFDKGDKDRIATAIFTHGSKADIALKCKKYPRLMTVKGHSVRMELICALVRLADELDEDQRRADPELARKKRIEDEQKYPGSEFYWRFSQRIPGIDIPPPGQLLREISINLQFEQEDLNQSYEVGGKPMPFITRCLDKIVKINKERVVCCGFYPDRLKFGGLRLTLLPLPGQTAWDEPEVLVLSDGTSLDDLLRKLPEALKPPAGPPPSDPSPSHSPPPAGSPSHDPSTVAGPGTVRLPGSAYSPDHSACYVPHRAKGDLLIGRAEHLALLQEKLRASAGKYAGRVVLCGIGGLGKTQLAAEFCHLHRDDYPGGIYWFDAAPDGNEIDSQLIAIADHALWIHPESKHAEKLAVARQVLRARAGCLLVFDNVDELAVIRPLLQDLLSGTHILLTSRREQPGFAAVHIPLLSAEESLTLLRLEAGRTPKTPVELEAAGGIGKQLDGLPLALELVGAHLRRRSAITWADYAGSLRQKGLAAKGLSWVGFADESLTHHAPDLYAALRLDEVFFQESPLLKDVLDVLTWAGPTSMGEDILNDLLGQPDPVEFKDALSCAEQIRVLRSEPGLGGTVRYRMHRLVQQVRQHDAPRPPQARMEDLLLRICRWFETHRKDIIHLPLFEAELDHLRIFRQHARDGGDWSGVVRLSWLEAYPPYHRGDYRRANGLIHQALDLFVEKSLQDRLLLAHLNNDLSSTYHCLGQSGQALGYAQTALMLRREALGEKHPDTATALGNVGADYFAMGQLQQALQHERESLAILREVQGEKHPDTAHALCNLGMTYGALGQAQQALHYQKQALAIRREVLGEKHPDTAVTLGNLGDTYCALGQLKEGLLCAEQTLAHRREVLGEKHPDTAAALGMLSATYGALGQPQQALEYGEQALALMREVLGEKHPRTGGALGNLGSAYCALGQPRRGLEYGQQTLALLREVLGEKHRDIAEALNNVASAYYDLGQPQLGLQYAEQALALLRAVMGERHPNTGAALGNLGATYMALGQPQRALEYGQQALEIKREVFGEKHPHTAGALNNVGSAYFALGQPQQAAEYGQQALALLREVLGEGHPLTAKALGNLAAIHGALGKHSAALEGARRGLEVLRKSLGDAHPDTLSIRTYLAKCLLELKQGMQALKVIQEGMGAVPRNSAAFEQLQKIERQLCGSGARPIQKGFRTPPKSGGQKKNKAKPGRR